jgi:hypothetical protein
MLPQGNAASINAASRNAASRNAASRNAASRNAASEKLSQKCCLNPSSTSSATSLYPAASASPCLSSWCTTNVAT